MRAESTNDKPAARDERAASGPPHDRVALVTGAGSGIGRESALLFATEGAAVAVLDRDVDAASATALVIEGDGGRAIAVVCDITERSSVDDAVERVSFSCKLCSQVLQRGQHPVPDASDCRQVHGGGKHIV